MEKRIYITTPIYYINAKPHIGHAYTTILCDVARRFYRLLGYETYFLTGTDEHGDKIFRAAQGNQCEPSRYADEISALYRNLWPTLHIQPDDFIRTTEERHKKVVREVLSLIYQRGEIYHARYGGFYCTGCERFYTEKELVDGKCPDHLVEPEWIEEENYFFKMSMYQEWLIQYVKDHPDFIRPERYRNETLSFLKDPLKDLCISRPKSRLPWGIPLPFDDKYVTYVWFDALVNYISAIGYPDGEKFKKFWHCSNHFTAKDILKPHAIYWPCMLKAAGVEPYLHLNVHGYWSMDKQKMSKTLGNVVAPLDLSRKYGVDSFRYFLLKDMTFGLDADFSEENLVKRFNSDLANDFGNLVKRITEMIGKYCESRIPEPGPLQEPDKLILASLEELVNSMPSLLDNLKFNDLLEKIMNVARASNKYVNDQAPWDLYKKKDISRLHTVLYTAAKLAVSCAHLLGPVTPEKSAEAFDQFGITRRDDQSIHVPLQPGLPVKTGEILFPKVESPPPSPDTIKTEGKDEQPAAKQGAVEERIEYEDFAKVKLFAARVLVAERVPKTDKLMRMDIDLGFEKRQIVAGIAMEYAPEEMIGKTIVVVENLKSKKMKGLESKGMLLAAHGKKGLSLITVDRPVEPGSDIS
ncbi:methionine--tRNA ligase [Candidatus Sumerlaeota bacterium]|nr:methionine--tRNA ligase [Candidatus Sumerlaeota bacterium]